MKILLVLIFCIFFLVIYHLFIQQANAQFCPASACFSQGCPNGYSSYGICYSFAQNFGSCCTQNPVPTPTPAPPTCQNAGGFCTNYAFTCGSSYVLADGPTYSCQQQYCCLPATCQQLGGICTNSVSTCISNNDTVYNGSGLSCTQSYCCIPNPPAPTPTPIPPCTSNLACGTCGGAAANTCSNNGTQTCTNTQPSNCQANLFTQSCSYNNCSTNFACTGGVCTTSINVHVVDDKNHNSVSDYNDSGAAGIPVHDGGGNTINTDSNGNVTFTGKTTGTYTISITVPSGSQAVGATSKSVTITNTSPNPTVTFYVTPLYTIGGYVYYDVNQDGLLERGNGETGVTNVNAVVNGTNYVTDASGHYASNRSLISGQYIASYSLTATQVSQQYRFTTPASRAVYVGQSTQPGYSVSGNGDTEATLNDPTSGDINNVNFGIINENSFLQGICSDLRFDTGYSQRIPSTASCNGTSGPYAIVSNTTCTNDPGILFSGSTNPNYGAGSGPSTTGQQVGNATFPESFVPRLPSTIATSNNFVSTSSNNLSTPSTHLTSICPILTNCVLSESTPGGIYYTTAGDGPVSISIQNGDGTYQLGTTNYSFIIGGDLTLTSNVIIQNGYSAGFTVAGNIHVAGNVGESDYTSLNPDIEGLYSADKNFYIDSLNPAGSQCYANGQPKELKLNLIASVVVDAAQQGGAFINNRDGCAQDLSCPTTTHQISPQQLLHAPAVFKTAFSFWQELNPQH